MHKHLLLFLLLVSLGFIDTKAQSDLENPLAPFQETRPIFIGPVFGYNRSLHSVSLKTFADAGNENVAPCPTFENGQDNGFFVGFTYEHILGDYKNSNSSIIVRAMYQTMPSYLEVGGDTYPSLVSIVDANGNVIQQKIINSSTLHILSVDYSMATFEAVYKINPFEGMNLGFTIGPTFDYALSKTFTQEFRLMEPLNARFRRADNWEQLGIRYENNDRTIVVNDGDIPNASGLRVAVKAGIQYEILMGRFYIVPGINYNFGITELSSDQSWRVSAVQAGFDIRFSL
jgi:hypothetical protein